MYLFLRLAVILFMLPFIVELYTPGGFSQGFVPGLLNTILLVFYAGMIILFFILGNTRFSFLGFSIILLISFYKIITDGIVSGFHQEVAEYFFSAIVSIYFIRKSYLRTKKVRSPAI